MRRFVLPVLRGPARGLRFSIDFSIRGEAGYVTGRWEKNFLSILRDICKPGMNVWDCGTHIGFYTAFIARAVAPGRVLAVEPDPQNAERTRETIRVNKLTNAAVLERAIADSSGTLEFVGDGHPTQRHLLGTFVGVKDSGYSGHSFSVKSVSIDDLFADTNVVTPDLIKLDIEGAEGDALRASQMLGRKHRPIIAIELHNPNGDEALWHFCQSNRYSMRSVETGRAITNREDVHDRIICTPER